MLRSDTLDCGIHRASGARSRLGAWLRAGLLSAAVLGIGVLIVVPGSGRCGGAVRQGKLRSLSIQNVTVQEGDGGTTAASFQRFVVGPTGKTVKVRYATVAATAISPTDYQMATGTLQIKSGKTTGKVTVLVNGDTIPNPMSSSW